MYEGLSLGVALCYKKKKLKLLFLINLYRDVLYMIWFPFLLTALALVKIGMPFSLKSLL